MAYRQSFETCPRCRAALEDAGAVRACTKCRGQWVLEPVLAEMVAAMLPPGVLGTLTLAPVTGTRTGPCPSCGIAMAAVSLYGIDLERCPKDHGVWFDPDELEAGLLRSADPARGSPAERIESPTLVAPPKRAPPAPVAEPVEPIIEPAMPTPQEVRPSVPVPSIDDVVNRMMRGWEFRAGRDTYRWDAAQHRIVVEGTRSRVISDEELTRVVETSPSTSACPTKVVGRSPTSSPA